MNEGQKSKKIPKGLKLLLCLLGGFGFAVLAFVYAGYKIRSGDTEIKTTKEVMEFSVFVFLCLMIWLMPIALYSNRSFFLPFIAGSITFIIFLTIFKSFIFSMAPLSQAIGEIKTEAELESYAKGIWGSVNALLILTTATLVCPFIVGGLVAKGQKLIKRL